MSRPIGIQVLEGARAIVANPNTWCQGSWATDAEGFYTDWDCRDAARWCALGALAKAAEAVGVTNVDAAVFHAADMLGKNVMQISSINDSRVVGARERVIALFDKAIAGAKV